MMDRVKTTRDAHKRVLMLVAEENWGALRSSDEGLLHSMLVTGHLAFAIDDTIGSRFRLRITPDGWRYLSYLSGQA